MTAKNLSGSNTAKNDKPSTTMTNTNKDNKNEQKMHMPCKNSLPT